MSTPQIETTMKTPHLDFSDTDWTEIISMYNASHDVSPLKMEQDEDFEACYNSLTAYETPHLDFSDADWDKVYSYKHK